MDKNNKDVVNYTKKTSRTASGKPFGLTQEQVDRQKTVEEYLPKGRSDMVFSKKQMGAYEASKADQNRLIARAAKESALARKKASIGSKLKKG
jgi:hypothetical protein